MNSVEIANRRIFTNYSHEVTRVMPMAIRSYSNPSANRHFPSIEQELEPYIIEFTQHWNVYLESNDHLVAEIYKRPANGMRGIMFYVINRSEVPLRVHSVDASYMDIQKQFPNVMFSDIIPGKSFLKPLNEVIIVVQPIDACFWTAEQGASDADDTMGKRVMDTLPEEWRGVK